MKNHILFFASLLMFLSCKEIETHESKENDKFCLDEISRENIGLLTLKNEKVKEEIHLTGSIEANPDRVVHFVSLVDGIISKTYFSLGNLVQKGQILAEMQSTELTSLQMELQSLKAQIELAEVDLEAKEQMFHDGIASNKERLEVQNQLKILKAEKHRIKSNLSLFSGSPNQNVFLIKAPTSGTITAKNINSGSTVTDGGEILFSISDLNEVWAMANVYATEIADIKSGMPIELKTLSYPNEIFKGEIDVISQVLDDESRVLKARIVLDNQDFKLKPGMLADITVTKSTEKQAIGIPTSSIVFFNNKNYALVYHDDCNIEIREIQLLTETNGLTYIESGLKINEQIITKNSLLIFEELSK